MNKLLITKINKVSASGRSAISHYVSKKLLAVDRNFISSHIMLLV